jgi:hypothetical protein
MNAPITLVVAGNQRYGYSGPIPRIGEGIELRVPPSGTYTIFVVENIRYTTNGPFDSDSVRVTEVEVRGRLI